VHDARRTHSARKTNYDYTDGKLPELIDIVIESKASLFVSAVGIPPRWAVDKLHAAGIPVMNMIGSTRHVNKALDAGVDIICAQGTEGGGTPACCFRGGSPTCKHCRQHARARGLMCMHGQPRSELRAAVSHAHTCYGGNGVVCVCARARGGRWSTALRTRRLAGHTGDTATTVLIPQVVDMCRNAKAFNGDRVQVIAAGGIFDGKMLAVCPSISLCTPAPPKRRSHLLTCCVSECWCVCVWV